MQCHRCHGLMTVDSYFDMGSSNPLWLRGWRCVNCGEVIEPGISTNRVVHRNWLRHAMRRLVDRRRSLDHALPLTA